MERKRWATNVREECRVPYTIYLYNYALKVQRKLRDNQQIHNGVRGTRRYVYKALHGWIQRMFHNGESQRAASKVVTNCQDNHGVHAKCERRITWYKESLWSHTSFFLSYFLFSVYSRERVRTNSVEFIRITKF